MPDVSLSNRDRQDLENYLVACKCNFCHTASAVKRGEAVIRNIIHQSTPLRPRLSADTLTTDS